jgi:hypothetical protein
MRTCTYNIKNPQYSLIRPPAATFFVPNFFFLLNLQYSTNNSNLTYAFQTIPNAKNSKFICRALIPGALDARRNAKGRKPRTRPKQINFLYAAPQLVAFAQHYRQQLFCSFLLCVDLAKG